MKRESMEFDVVIIGAGPAGLSAACRLRQLALKSEVELSVCVLEKAADIGGHTLAGTIFEPRALDELFPEWRDLNAPVTHTVKRDETWLLKNATTARRVPSMLVPSSLDNKHNYIISLGELCIWLAQQAQDLGVEVFTGFTANELTFDDNGSVKGIITGDMGRDKHGAEKDNFMPGMELNGKYTLITEGSRGHLGKQLIEKYQLDNDVDPQHYGLGIKELWQIDPDLHQPGLVMHSIGWPLAEHGATGGAFLYHLGKDQVYVGLITDLNYQNPYLSPFEEFQRLKLHPAFNRYLKGGKRLAYGARTVTKGGYNSLPKMVFPGGLLLGCDAGTLNVAKLKGTHTAMKTGMIGAEAVFSAMSLTRYKSAHINAVKGKEVPVITSKSSLEHFTLLYEASWVYQELYQSRNFAPITHRCNAMLGITWFEQNILHKSLPFTMHDSKPDHSQLQKITKSSAISYPKPDNIITFDRLSSVFLTNIQHDADQPCHLKLTDPSVPMCANLPRFAEPAQRYCPAAVYEIVTINQEVKFQINAQNCIHCKACDIKDPAQNIVWTPPEGGSGPNYAGM
ncbi:MAG: electron transfer flavoprotein-ubiquinone oxidoreductase [Moritella sp.]|uniref:electron transfer flavoprotein-ubiquinone oxidoreductase n=1 Tax=Moritella sp. TaxID=78556 RepID=UPI0029B2E404|nr:electron transfer flavoprotein-ubiquinone oxidoreductase [Moritella sp.]MDX2319488.1 electron transfer flavoprotein-ubiquinone oxidoreductase [Moritella sp.]